MADLGAGADAPPGASLSPVWSLTGSGVGAWFSPYGSAVFSPYGSCSPLPVSPGDFSPYGSRVILVCVSPTAGAEDLAAPGASLSPDAYSPSYSRLCSPAYSPSLSPVSSPLCSLYPVDECSGAWVCSLSPVAGSPLGVCAPIGFRSASIAGVFSPYGSFSPTWSADCGQA